MVTNIIMILGGFFLLIKGADYLVSGASSLARRFGIPSLVVGLTVVAFGTSAPEFFVNIIAATKGITDIAVGNVLGSNMANLLLVLGATAVIAPLTLKSNTVWKEIPFSLLAAALVLIFGSDMLLEGSLVNQIGRIEGLALFAFFIIFIVYTFGIREEGERPQEQIQQIPVPKSVFFLLGGLVALAMGGQLVVEGASSVAVSFGVTANLIALTIVALGTSLPELVASVIAAKKGHTDIAIGNVIGSSIFNILFVLSSSAIVRPLMFQPANVFDAFAVVVATLAIFFLLFIGKKHTIGKNAGISLLVMYASFIIFAIIRG